MTDPVPIDRYRSLVGTSLGKSAWVPISQELIDQFARCTRDEQFIHVDHERAAESPFGCTIAHGFLTLSMLTHLSEQVVPKLLGTTMSVNFGFDNVRFLSPVRAGQAIRGSFALKEFAERKPGQWRSALEAVVEIEGEERPALVTEWLVVNFLTPEPPQA